MDEVSRHALNNTCINFTWTLHDKYFLHDNIAKQQKKGEPRLKKLFFFIYCKKRMHFRILFDLVLEINYVWDIKRNKCLLRKIKISEYSNYIMHSFERWLPKTNEMCWLWHVSGNSLNYSFLCVLNKHI